MAFKRLPEGATLLIHNGESVTSYCELYIYPHVTTLMQMIDIHSP